MRAGLMLGFGRSAGGRNPARAAVAAPRLGRTRMLHNTARRMRQPTFHPSVADEQPEEMIPGEIPAPATSLGNPDVVLHHLSAIAFGAADPGLAGRNFPPASAIPAERLRFPRNRHRRQSGRGEDLHLPASTNEANGPKHSTVGSALETADFQASCVGF